MEKTQDFFFCCTNWNLRITSIFENKNRFVKFCTLSACQIWCSYPLPFDRSNSRQKHIEPIAPQAMQYIFNINKIFRNPKNRFAFTSVNAVHRIKFLHNLRITSRWFCILKSKSFCYLLPPTLKSNIRVLARYVTHWSDTFCFAINAGCCHLNVAYDDVIKQMK